MCPAVTNKAENTDKQASLDLATGDLSEDCAPKLNTPLPTAEDELEENEPYLGPAWAVVMLVLYLLKEAFPAEQFSVLWWLQLYVIVLVIAITIFTLIKRHQFYRAEQRRRKSKQQETITERRN